MATKTSQNARACKAFIEVLRRTEDMIFSKNKIIISEKIKIGDPVICTVEAQKENEDSSHAKGQVYIYPDLVVVCIEMVWKKLMEPTYPHHYEYISY